MRPLARTVLTTLLASFLLAVAVPPAFADAPAGVDDAYSTPEDQALNVAAEAGVLVNDTDGESGALTAQSATDPAHGDVALDPSGSFVYTPEADFHGTDTFTYQPFHEADGGNVTTVTITVVPANDPPAANDEGPLSTDEDTPLAVDVLANDDDVDGDTLTVQSVADAAHGTTQDNGDGTVTYTPDQDFHGGDSFTYTASDGNGGTDDGTVTMSVGAVNDAPVANDDAYGTPHDDELVVPVEGVLENDDDVDVDGLTAVAGDDPAAGTLTRHPNGSFEYDPEQGFVGDVSFTYSASDGALPSNVATVTISVTDQAPASQNDAYPELTGTFLEDTTLQVDAPGVLGNDSDLEGDAMSPAVDTGPAHGDVTLDADGSFDYMPDPDFAGQDTFTYRATDAVGGLGAPAAVTIDVTGTQDAPTALDDTATTPEDTPVIIAVLANDSDPDEGDTLSINLPSSVAGDGSVSDNGDGTVTYTPAQDSNGSDGFDYSANDGHGGTASAHVSVTVTAVKDAPVGAPDDYTVASKPFGSPTSVLANDSDPDAGDTLHAVLVTGPTLGTLLGGLHQDGTFTYSPAANVCERTDTFTYKVVDAGAAQSAPVTVTLDVSLGRTEAVMTIARSATTIPYHGSVTVTAHLTPFSKGAKITISRTPLGDAPIPLVTHAPDAQGNLSFVVPALLKRNAFSATSKFDNCHTQATSPTKAVLVRALVTSRMANFFKIKDGYRLYHVPDPDDPNTAPKLIGAITPRKTGSATIEWQRRSGGKFVAYGQFDWPIQGGKVTALLTSGAVEGVAYRIRVKWGGDQANVAAPSPWVYFRVVP